MNGKKFTGLFSVLMLTVLPGCDWFGSKDAHGGSCCGGHGHAEGTGEVLLTIKGKPVIHASDLENYVDQIKAENPQVAAILDAMPQARQNIFSGMVEKETLMEWARQNGVYDRDSYKKDYALALEMLDRQIIQKYFQEDLLKNVSVSESDAKKYYEDNKNNIPDLIVTPASEKDGKKTAAVYRPFAEVKDAIVKMLENEKASELYVKQLENLKSEYAIEENKAYFQQGAADNAVENEMAPAMEALETEEVQTASESAQAA